MKAKLRLAWNALLAAVTSPEAVQKEKALGVLIATRVLLAIGAGDGIVRLVQSLAG